MSETLLILFPCQEYLPSPPYLSKLPHCPVGGGRRGHFVRQCHQLYLLGGNELCIYSTSQGWGTKHTEHTLGLGPGVVPLLLPALLRFYVSQPPVGKGVLDTQNPETASGRHHPVVQPQWVPLHSLAPGPCQDPFYVHRQGGIGEPCCPAGEGTLDEEGMWDQQGNPARQPSSAPAALGPQRLPP